MRILFECKITILELHVHDTVCTLPTTLGGEKVN